MRNAGDRSPSGSTGRRQRAVASDAPGRASGNGGSLFVPAYRVNRPGSAPGESAPHGAADGTAYAQAGAGYDWADDNATHSTSAAAGYLDGDDLAGGGSDWPDEPVGTLYSWADDTAGEPWPQASLPGNLSARSSASNAVRGLPPAPGDPPHLYPPGPFAAWNRSASADADRGGHPGARRGDPSRQLAAATITPDEFDTDFSLPAIRDPAPGSASRTAPARSGSARGGSPSGSRTASPPGRSGSSGSNGRGSRSGSTTARGSGSARSGRRQDRPSGRAGQRAGHHSVRIAIGAAAAIVAAVAVVLVLTSHSPGSTGGAGASQHNTTHRQTSGSASPSPSTLSGTWRYIAVRATDPVKLTARELYPADFTNSGVSYRRSIAAKAQGCRSALIGSSLQAAVHHAGCTQAIRASYFSTTAKTMATIGVFNLKTYKGATAAASAAGRTEFVAQLPAHTGPTRQIGQGTGIEYAGVKGHYLVLVYAEFINLQAPKNSAQRARLDTFISQLIAGTVNVSLSYRMANGEPPHAG